MADFRGYLLASNGIPFPHAYIQYDTYSTLPNSREEIKAYRDDNTRDLTRITASGTKSSFGFKLRDGMHLWEAQEVLNWLKSNYTIPLERKLTITYWNQEDLVYKTSDFYCADIKWEIKTIRGDDIIYKEAQVDFVEY